MNIQNAPVIQQVISLLSDNEILRLENERLRNSSVDSAKFYNCALSTETVASLHSVSPALVRKYVAAGLIETHPRSTDSKILIRGSVALSLDFRELKTRYSYMGGK